MMSRRAFALAAVLLASLSSLSANAQVEPLLGYLIDEGGITFQVGSGGCTTRESFRVERSGDMLSLVRVVPDACEAYLEWGVTLTFGLAELGLEADGLSSIVIANPLSTHAASRGFGSGSAATVPQARGNIGEALLAAPGTPVRLGGFLWGEGSELLLCEALLESMPPHCGDASIPVDGLERTTVPGGLSREGDTVWSHFVEVVGVVRGGRLTESVLVVR
jgi:hypothetical protein